MKRYTTKEKFDIVKTIGGIERAALSFFYVIQIQSALIKKTRTEESVSMFFRMRRIFLMKKMTHFIRMKEEREKMVMLTAYDYPTARIAERAGVDLILVGDSLGMVVLGYDSTVKVTVDDMIHHSKAVRRGAPNTFVVVDMPFGSYHGSINTTVHVATRMYQETGADALKLEGAGRVIKTLRRLTETGIPVVAHLGLLPQSAATQGGYKVQGKTVTQAEQLIEDAKACERAGAIMIVVEMIPHELAQYVRDAVSIPVIGIGAGRHTDGQVLVVHDLVRYGDHYIPKFVETFANAGEETEKGIRAYVEAVRKEVFPAERHQFSMPKEQLRAFESGDEQ